MAKLVEVEEKDLVPGRYYKLKLEMGDKAVERTFWVIYSGTQVGGNLLLSVEGHPYPLIPGYGRFYQEVDT